MNYRLLGNSGIKVSELCFGNMTWGGEGGWVHVGLVDQQMADQMFARCLDAGINFFDTANIYSAGQAEEMLGRAMAGKRQELVIATKVRGRTGPGLNDVGLSRLHIIRAVEDSLRRLNTDWIDLYQVHSWDFNTPLEETLAALHHLVESGKVRYIGCSNFSGWQLDRALMLSEIHNWSKFITLQPLYNLIHRELEWELVPLCEREKIGILPWSPLAGGFLTGKYRSGKDRPSGARRSDPTRAFLKFDEERGFKIIDALEETAAKHNGTIAQSALNWLLAKTTVTSVIIGARSMEQLEDNIAGLKWKLTADEVERLDEVSAVPLPYPYFMQAGWR